MMGLWRVIFAKNNILKNERQCDNFLGSVAKIIFVYFEAIIISFKCYFNPNLITQITLL
jgi:hypothetical protein